MDKCGAFGRCNRFAFANGSISSVGFEASGSLKFVVANRLVVRGLGIAKERLQRNTEIALDANIREKLNFTVCGPWNAST